MRTETRCHACPKTVDVLDVVYLAPGRSEWKLIQWCGACRASAERQGYGMYVWTDIIGRCSRGCGRVFRASRAALAMTHGQEPQWTDKEIVESWDFCLSCLNGVVLPGEHDVPDANHDGNWQITKLTAREVFAIHAALEVVLDDEDGPYPGLRDALARVVPVRDAVRAAGFLPEDEALCFNEVAAAIQSIVNKADAGTEPFVVYDGDGDSHGEFTTLDEARGCVEFDRLDMFRIMQGLHIIEENNGANKPG